RVMATATSEETKPYYDDAKPTFDNYWEYRTGAKEKAADYIKSYVADPTIPSIPIPAKPADTTDLNAPGPAVVPGAVKLQGAKTAIPPGGKTSTTSNGSNGSKSAPAKGKTKPKPRKRR